jgi:hypothetical protein
MLKLDVQRSKRDSIPTRRGQRGRRSNSKRYNRCTKPDARRWKSTPRGARYLTRDSTLDARRSKHDTRYAIPIDELSIHVHSTLNARHATFGTCTQHTTFDARSRLKARRSTCCGGRATLDGRRSMRDGQRATLELCRRLCRINLGIWRLLK